MTDGRKLDVVTKNNLPNRRELEITNNELGIVVVGGESLPGYWINRTTGEAYVLTYAGGVNKFANGRKVLVSDQGVRNINLIKPSFDGTKVVVNNSLFDTKNNTWSALPDSVTVIAWHPQKNDQLAYLKNDGLYLLSLATGKGMLLSKFINRDWQLDWPSADTIYLTSRPTSVVAGETWKFDLKTKILTRVIKDEISPEMLWSPDARWGIKFNTGDIIDAQSKPLFTLANILSATTPVAIREKCVMSERVLYCAFPQDVREDVVLPDDHLKRKIYTVDDIYAVKIDLKGHVAQAKLLWSSTPEVYVDATQLSVNDDDLYFINRYDQKLYKVGL